MLNLTFVEAARISLERKLWTMCDHKPIEINELVYFASCILKSDRPDEAVIDVIHQREPSGITVMGHPGNFNAPQKVRLHPTKPYFCFAPMADKGFQIIPGENYISRFRFFVHNGVASATISERLWNDYVHPPIVLVTSIKDK